MRFLLSVLALSFLGLPSYASCGMVRVNRVVAVNHVAAVAVVPVTPVAIATFVPVAVPQYSVGIAPQGFGATAAATKADDEVATLRKEVEELKEALKKATWKPNPFEPKKEEAK